MAYPTAPGPTQPGPTQPSPTQPGPAPARTTAYTVVSFHAHPDDEAFYTGGTLARLSAEGHRVVIVTATGGGRGLVAAEVAAGGDLAGRRIQELKRSAAVLGCREVHVLGYEDSGLDEAAEPGAPGPGAFSRADLDEAADRLATILRGVGADVLTIYDPAGGYGHPDHVQVHRVGLAAAARASTPVVLEATVDRRLFLAVLRVLARSGRMPDDWRPERYANAYSDPARITHRVDVSRHWAAKRAAMAAHATQTTADEGVRTLAVFLRLPRPIFRVAFRHEWFVEVGRDPDGRPLDDVFATLRKQVTRVEADQGLASPSHELSHEV